VIIAKPIPDAIETFYPGPGATKKPRFNTRGLNAQKMLFCLKLPACRVVDILRLDIKTAAEGFYQCRGAAKLISSHRAVIQIRHHTDSNNPAGALLLNPSVGTLNLAILCPTPVADKEMKIPSGRSPKRRDQGQILCVA
jgi:hypothetical protein